MAFNVVEQTPDRVKVRRVLLSVFDKSGLDELVVALKAASPDVELYSTGGTYERLKGILGDDQCLHSVADLTGRSEMQGGLVKTLDFSIYLGLLAEPYNEAHEADLNRAGAIRFDAAFVSLYPFQEVTRDPAVSIEAARGNIDIGGPTMLRAAAKNFIRVAAVCDPADYPSIIAELAKNQGALGLDTRFYLAQKAFAHTADYDATIAKFLARKAPSDLAYRRT